MQVVADLVHSDPCFRPFLHSNASLLVALDGGVILDDSVVIDSFDDDAILLAVADFVDLDSGLVVVFFVDGGEYAGVAVSDEVAIDEGISADGVYANSEVLNVVEEELGLGGHADLHADALQAGLVLRLAQD